LDVELAWIRRDGCLTHIGSDVEKLLGWTAEEAMAQPTASLVTPSTLKYLKENYFIGLPDSIVPQLFPMRLYHRDGHVVCCHAIVVCRYDGNGDLVEAQGVLKCQRSQCVQNDLLAWWPRAENGELAILDRLVEACST